MTGEPEIMVLRWVSLLLCILHTTVGASEFRQFTHKPDCPASKHGCRCRWIPQTRDVITDCSHLGLTSLPDDVSNRTSRLLLNGNSFHTITNGSFSNLNNLLFLDISNSSVYSLEANAFIGLKQLGVLLLKNNHVSAKNHSFAAGVFNPLRTQLKMIDLRGNLHHTPYQYRTYPQEAVSCLEALEVLKIDCVSDKSLPETFTKLVHLGELDFSEGSRALNIPDAMFESLAKVKVKVINFSGVHIGNMNGAVFSPLRWLKVLNLTNNPALQDSVVGIAASLRATAIEELYLNSTCLGVSGSASRVVQALNGTNLKVLTMDYNEIYDVEEVFSVNVPKLEVLTLKHNAMYEHFALFMDFSKMKFLRILDVGFQQTNGHSLCINRNTNRPSKAQTPVENNITQTPTRNKTMLTNGFTKAKFCLEHMACPVLFPDRLNWFSASHNGVHFTQLIELVLLNNGSLRHFDISNNGIQSIPKPIYCAPHVDNAVEFADISNNALECVNKSFAAHCTFMMKSMNVRRNKLGLLRGKCNEDPRRDFLAFLRNLHHLEILDISTNYIDFLHNDTFIGMEQLKKLIVANNRLSTWVPVVSHLTHLENLDLSDNNLEKLPRELQLTLNNIDSYKLNRTAEHLSLNLKGNPISCSCENLLFLRWLLHTQVTLQYLNEYSCVYKDGTKKTFSSNFQQIVADLETSCADKVWFILILTHLILYVIVVTMATTFYRFRHYIRYVFLRMRMRRERLEALIGQEENYEFDAFVSCTREGAKWTKTFLIPKLETEEFEMKFCVAQRDFVVGKSIMDNIVDTLNRSRKTILLIDSSFLDSRWCNEELLVSHHESLSRGYNMIICVFLPEVTTSERHLPPRINALRHQVTCLRWPRDPRARHVFWLMLERALRDRKPK